MASIQASIISSIIDETEGTLPLPSADTPNVNLSTNSSRLLPEIWLVVFPYLESSDLQSVSLVCSSFQYMAQPLLFSVLDTSPFLLSYNEMPILRPRKYLIRFLERLEHYKLPHIAHGVRHCWISPYPRSGFPSRSHNDDLDPNLIVDAAVAALPYFVNLTTISWHCIDILPKWWSTIQSLPITNLWLNSSSLPIDDTPPLKTIRRLDLDQWPWEGKVTNHVSIHEERSHGVSSAALQRITRPDTIQSISVPRSDTASNLLSILADETYYLVSLKLPFISLSDSNFALALEHCPNLVRLTIFPPSTDDRPHDIRLNAFGPSTLPSLASYEGPYTHVLKFCHQPLQRVSLWGFDDRPSLCNPDALTKTLKDLAETESVDSLGHLEMTVMAISIDLLQVLSSFRHLERIIIQSQESSSPTLYHFNANAPVTALYVMMGNATLPPCIKHVKLSTRLSGRSLHHVAQEHEAAAFMESFARRHPTVQRIEIEYGVYWTGMYSVAWGRTRENNTNLQLPSDTAYPGNFSSNSDSLQDVESDGGGHSSKSSSKDHILSTVVSTVHPLPLGRLTFTEHRRKIFFPHDSIGAIGDPANLAHENDSEKRFWNLIWGRLRRFLGTSSA